MIGDFERNYIRHYIKKTTCRLAGLGSCAQTYLSSAVGEAKFTQDLRVHVQKFSDCGDNHILAQQFKSLRFKEFRRAVVDTTFAPVCGRGPTLSGQESRRFWDKELGTLRLTELSSLANSTILRCR